MVMTGFAFEQTGLSLRKSSLYNDNIIILHFIILYWRQIFQSNGSRFQISFDLEDIGP